MSLRRLGLGRIDLFQLHRIDPQVPIEDQVGVLLDLQREGKIRHIGLSEVSVDQIRAAQHTAPIATVENLYNLSNRASDPVLDFCEAAGWASSRGSRSQRVSLRAQADRWTAWQGSLTRLQPSSHWRGCCIARR